MPDELFIMRPCKGSAAYSITPKRQLKLNLAALKSIFQKILAETPFMLIAQRDGIEVTVYESGKILVKKTEDMGKVRRIAEEIYSAK